MLRRVRAEDWIQVAEVERAAGHQDELVSATASLFLDRLTAGLYEDSGYARSFWILGTLCILIEPFLIIFSMDDNTWAAQLIIFAVSTWLFIMQTIGLLFFQKPWKGFMNRASTRSWLTQWSPMGSWVSISDVARGLFFYFEDVVFRYKYILFEFAFVLLGWGAVVVGHRGVAALRIFRVFRVLWYYDIKAMRPLLLAQDQKVFKIVIEHDSNIIKGMKQIVESLNKLGKEMFTVTGRGGMLLILTFFYIAYVFSSMFFFDAADLYLQQNVPYCDGYLNCWYTMIRYCFFDQNGFNFMWDLYPAHKLMFYGSILYLMAAALGILFGVLAIFGTPFQVLENAVESSIKSDERDILNQLDNIARLIKARSRAIEVLERKLIERRALRLSRNLNNAAPVHAINDPRDPDPGSGASQDVSIRRDTQGTSDIGNGDNLDATSVNTPGQVDHGTSTESIPREPDQNNVSVPDFEASQIDTGGVVLAEDSPNVPLLTTSLNPIILTAVDDAVIHEDERSVPSENSPKSIITDPSFRSSYGAEEN